MHINTSYTIAYSNCLIIDIIIIIISQLHNLRPIVATFYDSFSPRADNQK